MQFNFVNLLAFWFVDWIKAVQFGDKNRVIIRRSDIVHCQSTISGFLGRRWFFKKWLHLLQNELWKQSLKKAAIIHALSAYSTGKVLFSNALGFFALPITRSRSFWVSSPFVQATNVMRSFLDFLTEDRCFVNANLGFLRQ